MFLLLLWLTSLRCCPAGLAQLQVWFRSLHQPLAALLNAESQGRDGDTCSTQICAALVNYLLETRDPHKSQASHELLIKIGDIILMLIF